MSSLQRSIDDLKELVAFPSVSSTSNRPVSDWVARRLETLGFQVEFSSYQDERGIEKVNVVGRRDPLASASPGHGGLGHGGLAYFAHTDVVPAIGWTGPGGDPFQPMITDNRLYGRGSCDMKGSLAAMLTAASEITAEQQTRPSGSSARRMKKSASQASSTWSNTRKLTEIWWSISRSV